MQTVHASAVLVGARALLIRGPAGAGKSGLVLGLLQAAAQGQLRFARLVADDRVRLAAEHGRLIASPPAALAGLLEIRGLGIRRLPYEPSAVIGWVADLGGQAERLPTPDQTTVLGGVSLPRFAFRTCIEALPVLLAALPTPGGSGRTGSGCD
jgi:HPr kinase/phosphorylase